MGLRIINDDGLEDEPLNPFQRVAVTMALFVIHRLYLEDMVNEEDQSVFEFIFGQLSEFMDWSAMAADYLQPEGGPPSV